MLVLAGVFACSGSLSAATAEEADGFYQNEQWAEAASAYESLVAETPGSARALYRLAVSHRQLGNTDQASAWLEKAAQAGVPVQFVQLEKAHIKMAQGSPAAAIAALDAAEIAGLQDSSLLTENEAFAPLAHDLRFKALVERVRKNEAPCEYDKKHRQFDFWVGQWRVVDATGTFQGTNIIQKDQNGCVLVERWTSAQGNTGMSINFYDAATSQWAQMWVSPTVLIDIRGGFKKDAMQLTGNIHYLQSGENFPFRGTWSPQEGGIVRQHFEQSADGGKNWSTWFDGYYHPAQDAAAQDGT